MENCQNCQKIAKTNKTLLNSGRLDGTKVTPINKALVKAWQERKSVPALHHKSYEAKHDGSRNVNNNNNLRSMENMSKTKERYARVATNPREAVKTTNAADNNTKGYKA